MVGRESHAESSKQGVVSHASLLSSSMSRRPALSCGMISLITPPSSRRCSPSGQSRLAGRSCSRKCTGYGRKCTQGGAVVMGVQAMAIVAPGRGEAGQCGPTEERETDHVLACERRHHPADQGAGSCRLARLRLVVMQLHFCGHWEHV